jgi:hypothetical protein
MVSHLRMHNFPCRLRDDDIRLLGWHVAMNALVQNLVAQLFRKTAALPLMAGKAFLRIEFDRLFARMDVVTSRAAHLCGRAIAFAALKQSDLVAVNIGMFYIGGWKGFEVITERPTRNVREGRRQGFSLDPVVAFGAQIDLAVARELCWIQDAVSIGILQRGSMLRFLPNMVRAGTMTAFARDARYQAFPVISIRCRVGG